MSRFQRLAISDVGSWGVAQAFAFRAFGALKNLLGSQTQVQLADGPPSVYASFVPKTKQRLLQTLLKVSPP